MISKSEVGPRGPNYTEILAGLVVAALCLAFAWEAASYGIGSPRRMGAGFFPFFLGLIGVGLGGLIALAGYLRPSNATLPVRWRRLLCIGAAFLLFALAIEPAGLLLTIPVVTMIGGLGDPQTRLHESFLLGLGLAAAIWIVFVVLLGLAIPVYPDLG